MKIYSPGERWEAGEFPALLAIGDSWFWYPKNNVLQALATHPKLKDPFRNIQMLGQNGAKLEQYVFGRYARQLARELQAQNRKYYSAILISGAGNDAVDYRLGLFRNCSAAGSAEQCINEAGMESLMGRLATAMSSLLYQIRRAYENDGLQPDIFLHAYDYPVPDGRGFNLAALKVTGPWLAKAMDDSAVPNDPALRKAICTALIKRLHAEFSRFADPGNKVHLIDSRGCLVSEDYKDDWDNELHPSSKGFEKIVDERWIPVLRNIGYAY